MTDQRYRVRTASGQQFTWVGDFSNLVPALGEVDRGTAFLECLGGAFVQIRHVESMTPLGEPPTGPAPAEASDFTRYDSLYKSWLDKTGQLPDLPH